MNQTSQNVVNTGEWTSIEHQRFLQGLTYFGRNWGMITNYVNTRKQEQIRSHAQKFIKKLKSQIAQGDEKAKATLE